MTKEVLENGDALALRAAELFVKLAADAVRERGRFAVALSGGSTPRKLHALLAGRFKDDVDWSKVFVFFGDERFLPPYNEDSNYYMADDTLLARVDIPPENVFPFVTLEVTPEESARIYEGELTRFFGNGLPRFDLIFLGMGEDGHTASLFPDNPVLAETEAAVAAVHNSPKPPPERMTLTLKILNAARNVIFLVGGAGKREALARMENGERLPASLVEPDDGNLLWLLDEAAAA